MLIDQPLFMYGMQFFIGYHYNESECQHFNYKYLFIQLNVFTDTHDIES